MENSKSIYEEALLYSKSAECDLLSKEHGVQHAVNSLKKFIIDRLAVFKFGIPLNKDCDNAYALLQFVSRHGRLPSSDLIVNDVIFKIRTSEVIDLPLRRLASDKHLAKFYIKSVTSEKYVVPTLMLFRKPDDLMAAKNLKYPFYLKATHTCGGTFLINNFDEIYTNEILSYFSENYYARSRERNYKNLSKCMLAEELMQSHVGLNGNEIFDVKIFCVLGVPKVMQIGLFSHQADVREYYEIIFKDSSLQLVSCTHGSTKHNFPTEYLFEMYWLAQKLSAEFSFVRVDLLLTQNGLKVGELTNLHWSGNDHFVRAGGERFISDILFDGVSGIDVFTY